MISKDKTYRTRDGREVRIYATDGYTNFPVHGAVKQEEGWMPLQWRKEGFWDPTGHGLDLIEVKPRIKRSFWVNLYNGSNRSGLFDAKADANLADKQTSLGVRIACVKVEIDCEKGEGL